MRVLAILLAVAAHAHAAPCSGLANELASTRGASQLVTVEASGYRTTVASLVLWERTGGCWRRVAGPWTARLGRSGLSDHKREGDGATPTGAYALGATVYGIAPDPGVRTAYHRLVCGDWWDEDPSSPGYNTFRHVPCGTAPPFGGGSEALWQATVAYQQFAVVEYNVAPRRSGPRLGDLPARRSRRADERLHQPAAGAAAPAPAPAAPGRAPADRDRHGGGDPALLTYLGIS